MADPENQNEEGEDLITNVLPADVCHNILSRLSLVCTVRVSSLSTEWMSRCLSVPDLVFDSYIERTFPHDFARIIYRVLLHHRGPINSFALEAHADTSHTDINHWIRHLSSRHQVRHFDLYFWSGDIYTVPSYFFEFQHIKSLKLCGCQLTPPPQFQGFKNLVSVDFESVRFLPGRFISQCPLLERVELLGCNAWDPLEIEGPNLRSFRFHGFANSIHFKSCPLLAEVTLCTPSPLFGYLKFTPCECLNLTDIESLVPLENWPLYTRELEFSSAGDILLRLKVLDFSMKLTSIQELVHAISFIRHSPNLDTLILRLWNARIEEAVTDFIRSQQERPNQDLRQLKKIELRCYFGKEPQKELAKYLVEAAAGLDEMLIKTAFFSALYDRFKDLPAIMRAPQYRWASPTARLTVRGPQNERYD